MEDIKFCIYGDGCLNKLYNEKHAQEYSHVKSFLPGCPAGAGTCPLYTLAYNYVVGDKVYPEEELKEANLHCSLFYHPPIRKSQPVKKRSRSVSYDAKSNSVPRLNLGTKKDSRPINSDPGRKSHIVISPKKKSPRSADISLSIDILNLREEMSQRMQTLESQLEILKRLMVSVDTKLTTIICHIDNELEDRY